MSEIMSRDGCLKPGGLICFALVLLVLAGCEPGGSEIDNSDSGSRSVDCAPDNAGLIVPEHFCVRVFAEHIAHLRHMAVSDRGVVYAAQRNRRLGIGGISVLSDLDGDGRSDEVAEFSERGVTGLVIHAGYLYAGEDEQIVRWPISDSSPVPQGPAQVMISGLPASGYHGAKALTLDGEASLYVNVGAPSNACQLLDREPGSPGVDPCRELENAAGIWRFEANRPRQSFASDGERYASGIRHTIAMAWNKREQALYVVQHGRDELATNWPDLYTLEQGEQAPGELVLRVSQGSEFGWPYCYYDPGAAQYRLSPEYGGDGKRLGRCESLAAPFAVLAAHSGPNDMLYYDGRQFPERYRGGFFVALHGANRRSSGTGVGYQVAFVRAGTDGIAQSEVFLDGFAGDDPTAPRHRPTGLALGPEGEMYVSDSVAGRIYRIDYLGP